MNATPRLKLQLGDITAMGTEAIVNSTDEALSGGGPLHEAIHRAAGPGLAEECAALESCLPGEVRITRGHGLTASFVLHTVPPTWVGGSAGELKVLESCYNGALRLARARGIRSVAFPSLGSGVEPQIPLEVAAPLAVNTILAFLAASELPEQVVLVCFNPQTYQAHQKALKEALP
jgi:O-acetyl-ADP-ribose deacetylase (regulator of RNase III)